MGSERAAPDVRRSGKIRGVPARSGAPGAVTEDADVVLELAVAIEARDWARVEQLLHPDVHWRDSSGARARAPQRPPSISAGSELIASPASWELRDGQIYRWNAGW